MKTIDKIPGGNPFKVPEDYFDEVNRKIIASTSGNYSKDKKKGIKLSLKTYLEIAASVAILSVLTYAGIRHFSVQNQFIPLSSSSTEEYSAIIMNEVDVNALEENIALEEIPSMGYQVEKEEIIDYLLLENIDINIIEGL